MQFFEQRPTCLPAVQATMRDFQTELRKILLSLIEVAQKLLALSSDAVELFKKANAMLDEDEDERVDETALRQLTEMGFPESRASKALRLNQYACFLLALGFPVILLPISGVILFFLIFIYLCICTCVYGCP